ncbi:AAA family ATPase [Tenacibaculum finnmarkense]|uniref:AAA family ATPase n=1 Tax=Tenacibaculum finnmarkense TaxID=2781243 RepID=UPI001E339BD4|nr:AAA family ATPase [Tenacibaculum finnmarkense]MCD8401350.1 ATP-binding protein [Tenacibaculum finnmarkense genomovar ulcerans]MCG8749283.1 AAA family ATPase [Tenacibaculum finnmarkense]
MNIIEQIEIKNFRSFGNRKKESYKVTKCFPLNIISGANDSGKSNILRALNLFFNKKTDLTNFFDFDKDFFKRESIDDLEIKEELVTIKIWFNNTKNKGKNKEKESNIYLPENFWVSRKWKKTSEYSLYDQLSSIEKDFQTEKKELFDSFLEENILGHKTLKSNARASLQKQLTDLINSIQFHYIPAIKDNDYFSHLYGELQQTLWKTKISSVEGSKNKFEKAIQEETNILMTEFKNSIGADNLNPINPVFQLPSDLINLFKALIVQTGKVDLKLRGDGYQAKLIPEILNFIAVKELSFTTNSIKSEYKAKKYFIWGFEEPENSYEYKNAQILAEKFRDVYCNNAQIFITTHSFNFLSLRSPNTSLYRVWKDLYTKSSKISKLKFNSNGKIKFDSNNLNSDWELLQEELGFFYLNEELNQLFEEKREQLNKIKEKIETIDKPIIYSEGYNYLYLEKAKEIFYPELEIEIKDAGGKNELQKLFKLFSKTGFNRFFVFFVFDCDAKTSYTDCHRNKTQSLIPYIFKTNNNNTIPEVQSGIENLFDDHIFEELNENEIFDIDEHFKNGIVSSRKRKLKKRHCETYIIETRNLDLDFYNFRELFEIIKTKVNRV